MVKFEDYRLKGWEICLLAPPRVYLPAFAPAFTMTNAAFFHKRRQTMPSQIFMVTLLLLPSQKF